MSQTPGNDFILTDYAKNLIEFKAGQLSRSRRLGQADRDEIQQELWMAVINQADHFDPARSSLNTFIDRVVHSAVKMILRERKRHKRAMGVQAVSLDAVIKNDDSSKHTLAAKITEDDHHRRLGTERHDEISNREQAEAVSSALKKVPADTYEVCQRVMAGSISSAAEDLTTSRRQIRKSLAIARRHLEAVGFKKS